MDKEQENTKKRKVTPLTKSEWLTFFFFPFQGRKTSLLHTDTFNRLEEERFKEHGFDKKLEESRIARNCGILFYIIIVLIIFILTHI